MVTMTQPHTVPPVLPDDADLVDRIFDYLLTEIPGFAQSVERARVAELKAAVRSEFAGDRQRIAPRTAAGRRDTVAQVLALFNGRNATQVARRLNISRASVYRYIKQAGPAMPGEKESLFAGRNETAAGVASSDKPAPQLPLE